MVFKRELEKQIAELERENADLRDNYDQFKASAIPEIERLQKENAELKEKNNQLNRKCDCLTNCNDGLQDLLSNDIDTLEQLTKAKELLQHFISMDLFQIAENDQDYNAIEQAEQFIKEIEK